VSLLRQAGRFLGVLAALAAFSLEAAVLRLLHRDESDRRMILSHLTYRYARRAAAILGVVVRVEGVFSRVPRRRLLVSNHLSYLDVVVFSSLLPVVFVTSADTRDKIGLGDLCKLAGCLFVNRRNPSAARADGRRIEAALREGFDVALFPEATSTPGDRILPFRAGLFQAACGAAATVQPLHLSYPRVAGRTFGPATRDLVCWYGDMTFVPHLWALAGCGRVEALVRVLPELDAFGTDPRALAHAAQASVELAHYGEEPTPAAA
jgi:1-acyl-sn-glycerol-3-phosphate acyltransferase